MSTLNWERHLCEVRPPEKLLSGADALADRLRGLWQRRKSIAALHAAAAQVEALEGTLRNCSDEVLRRRLADMRTTFRRSRRLADGEALLPALALVREAAARVTGMRPFFVQILAALALRRGCLAEMATGEGKSLTAALAAVLAGWSGRPCHVVTVNDYLAQRDAEKFHPFFEFCGVRASAVTGEMVPRQRLRGHAADVTYTTSKELLADFLRDRLCLGAVPNVSAWNISVLRTPVDMAGGGIVMRGLHSAIVDEADSVLIDEAVTPLIIAGADESGTADEAFGQAWTLAASFQLGMDYRRSESFREVELLPPGFQKVALFGEHLAGIWRGGLRKQELVLQALSAREFFHPGKQYVVQDGEVVIVDEFTGRLMPLRKWRDGLHQAIEAKENVEISKLDQILARMSFQRFFRQFRHLAGMTGTAAEAAREFWHIYRLPVIRIPTNRPCRRVDLPDRVFADPEEKLVAAVSDVTRRHATGQPLLIGTRSIATSEELAGRLSAEGLDFALLNATKHREEAQIIESAGQPGRITIATNMAGRGTDIILGAGVADLGGLHVVATERHESARIDRQLYGRSGRQGDPGSVQAFVSTEDELLRRHVGELPRRLLHAAARRRMAGCGRLAETLFSAAQRSAQRRAFNQRQHVLQQDDWLEEALAFTAAQA